MVPQWYLNGTFNGTYNGTYEFTHGRRLRPLENFFFQTPQKQRARFMRKFTGPIGGTIEVPLRYH